MLRYRDDTPTVHVMDLPTQLLINLLCEDRIAGSESSIYQVQLTLHEVGLPSPLPANLVAYTLGATPTL